MMPGPYNNGPPTPMMHHGRRQNQGDYYPHHGYYQQPQPQYHNRHATQYVQPHWYPPPYPMPGTYPPNYHSMPPQPPLQRGPLIVSSHPQPQAQVQDQLNPPVHRQSIPSSSVATPVQAAPSTPSVQSQPLESPATPTTSISASAYTPPPTSDPQPVAPVPTPNPVTRRMPFYPELPWYSVPEAPFPSRAPRRKRKARQSTQNDNSLELPAKPEAEGAVGTPDTAPTTKEQTESQASAVAEPSDLETPATSQAPSEVDSTHPPTLSSFPPSSDSHPTVPLTTARASVRPVVPIVPVGLKTPPSSQKLPQTTATEHREQPAGIPRETTPSHVNPQPVDSLADGSPGSDSVPATKPAPKSWADLVRTKPPTFTSVQQPNGNGVAPEDAFSGSKAGSLAEVIRSFSVNSGAKLVFLKPRGLVNTGNMCYMNSILQVLVFCIPCYDFLDQVGKRAAHSFKSETPLLDAMIIFMQEFPIIDSAESVEKLRMRLKDNELEQYGEAFIPEYVYDVIKRLPRFSSMRRGHQQDAEEFLGFLLEGLHDECVQVLKTLPDAAENGDAASPVSERFTAAEAGWLEVGPKQKAAITRSSGHIVMDSPITKIFGGKIRSELRVPGLKNSVTLEPYQPLQLDIGAPNVNNIVDALKGLTRSETLHGDFNSPRGPGTTATKQIFIETLPPVLILHLKRFQYDNTGGTQKIWKKVGYPLELTIPKEVFPLHKRNGMALSGMPKYRLTAVVYHHGKNASGGHYTVDVRRQDGTEWIRLDDTVIRRVRSEDVAEAGAEEDPKVLAKALEQHKRDASNAGAKNMFEQFEDADQDQTEESGWNQVNGSTGPSSRKWNAVANGEKTPSTAGKRTPVREGGVKDNKVAYILFYRKIE